MTSLSGYTNVERLNRSFVVERYLRVRVGGGYREEWTPLIRFVGVLSDASARSARIASARAIFVTHQVVQEGAPVARSGDRLLTGGKQYRVQFVENPGMLDMHTIYSVTEESVGS